MLNLRTNVCLTIGVISLLVFICLVSFNSAANVTKEVTPAERHLEHWVDSKLARNIFKRLERSSHFISKPLLLVVMKDGKIQPQADRLHAFVKQRLSERLLNYKVNILDSAQGLVPGHHRVPNTLNCEPHKGVRAYIALELEPQRAGRIKAKFRFIDAYDQSNSSIIHEYSSKIKLWRYNADDWQQTSFDEGLRGLRYLPFDINQPDLLAKYLSDNLTCLLRLKIGTSFKLAVDSPKFEYPLDSMVSNLSAYLAQNDEVTMLSSQEHANYVIRVDAHLIDQRSSLYQVRATVEDLRTHEILGGVPTSSYISLIDTVGVVVNKKTKISSKPEQDEQSFYRPASVASNISLSQTPILGVKSTIDNDLEPLSIGCIGYVGSSNCSGPFVQSDKPWQVSFNLDGRYRGAMVIASLVDEVGSDFKQITSTCLVEVDGRCDIQFFSEAGLYKGGFAIEASIYQGNAIHPVEKDNFFRQVYYVK